MPDCAHAEPANLSNGSQRTVGRREEVNDVPSRGANRGGWAIGGIVTAVRLCLLGCGGQRVFSDVVEYHPNG
jgi:hypothetical protein